MWSKETQRRATYKPVSIVHKIISNRPKVVYFPSCASRTMGPAIDAKEKNSLPDITYQLFEKAGFEIISPDFTGQCCGMPFNSKGMFEQADQKCKSTLQQLHKLSNDGEYPILIDTSPCKAMFTGESDLYGSLKIYEPVGFIEDVLFEYLDFTPVDETIMLHVTCSSRRMGLNEKMIKLAKRCASKVIIPEHIHCCGFAGDKGFTFPELNANALAPLKAQIPENCHNGYSNSRTCEIGLSEHSGIDYQSIIYLVDRATTANEI
ncbi:(Fe-S)-binding protein [Thalassotalea fonticola]|uniref:(Fe-S)-binding protein n=1 Tax=Thalassotalea fonticola TaxID=3065649 RepID=A0ABZ0GUX6_9GAMM|nr:(Fe-S)-binding protein [Colwelliaceae bacterium S1-1]